MRPGYVAMMRMQWITLGTLAVLALACSGTAVSPEPVVSPAAPEPVAEVGPPLSLTYFTMQG